MLKNILLYNKTFNPPPYPTHTNTNTRGTHPPTPWALYNMWTAPKLIKLSGECHILEFPQRCVLAANLLASTEP